MDKESGKHGMKKNATEESTKVDVPLDIALSLLRPDELEKLRRYVLAYVAEYGLKKETE